MKLTSFHGHKFRNEVKLAEVPAIIFTEQVIKDMEAIVTLCKDEVTWFGVVEREGMQFLIKEILVPPQENTKAMSDIMEHGMVIMAEELLNEEDGMVRFNSLRFYCHSHVNMGTGPSGQDEAQTKTFGRQCEDYLIRGICNKAGRLELTLFLYTEGIVIKDVEWTVLKEEDDMTFLQQWQNFLEERVTPPPRQVGFHHGRHSRGRWEGHVYERGGQQRYINGQWVYDTGTKKLPTYGFKSKTVGSDGRTRVEYYDGKVEWYDTKTGDFISMSYPGDRRLEDELKKKGTGIQSGVTQETTTMSGSHTTDSDPREWVVVRDADQEAKFEEFKSAGALDDDTVVRDIRGIPLMPNRVILTWTQPPYLIGTMTAVGMDAFHELDSVSEVIMNMHFPDMDELEREKAKNLIRLYGFEIDSLMERNVYFQRDRWYHEWDAVPEHKMQVLMEGILQMLQEEFRSYEDPQKPPSDTEKSFVEFLVAFKFACRAHIVEDRLEYDDLDEYFPIFMEDDSDTTQLHETPGGI